MARDILTKDQSQPRPDNEPEKVTLTVDQLTGIVDAAVEKALSTRPTQVHATEPTPDIPPIRRRMTNKDLQLLNTGKGRQTQEDVVALATSMGPVTHEPGFIPHAHESVAAKDFQEHRTLIDKIEALGYVVALDHVEFTVRWEPTELQMRGEHQVKIKLDPTTHPEPESAKPLIDQILNTEPRFSRIYLQAWVRGKPITGDRQIDQLAAEDSHQSMIAQQRDTELRRVESLKSVPGGLDYLDNVGVGKQATIG